MCYVYHHACSEFLLLIRKTWYVIDKFGSDEHSNQGMKERKKN